MQTAYQLAYIAHFVIIPAHCFYQLLITRSNDLGLCRVKQGTEMHAYDIAAHYFVFVVAKAFI